MVMRKFLRLMPAIFIFTASFAKAEVLFEGYSKILSGTTHIGYVISKYEYDNKTKKFTSTYFLKTGGNGSDLTESLKAYAGEDLAPISYEYTTILGKEMKTIDAKFNKGKMTAIVKTGGKTQTIRKDIPQGTLLSTFLVYLMLKSKEGLKSNANYQYQAIAEEDAEVYKGLAEVGKEEAYAGLRAFKIMNKFKDVRFESYVSERGEVMKTNSVGQGISTELMADPAKATAGFSVSQGVLKTLFGNVPAGKDNMVSKSSQVSEPPAGKQYGAPQGQGIQLKAEPAPVKAEPSSAPGK